jgi:hypothetical protein
MPPTKVTSCCGRRLCANGDNRSPSLRDASYKSDELLWGRLRADGDNWSPSLRDASYKSDELLWEAFVCKRRQLVAISARCFLQKWRVVVGGVCVQTATIGRHLFEMPPTKVTSCCGGVCVQTATISRHLYEMPPTKVTGCCGGVCLQTATIGRHLFEMLPTKVTSCCGRHLFANGDN